MGSKTRSRFVVVKALAFITLLVVLAAVVSSWRRRSHRRQLLIEELDTDRLLTDTASENGIEDIKQKREEDEDRKSDVQSNQQEKDSPQQPDQDDNSPQQPPHLPPPPTNHDYESHHHSPLRPHAHDFGHHDRHSHSEHHGDQEQHRKHKENHEDKRNAGGQRNAGFYSGDDSEHTEAREDAIIKEFPSTIEWYTRDDMKGGQRPLCRIAKPCMLSNGVMALPSWMQRSEALLHRCGISTHVFYDSLSSLPGVRHKKMIGVDFALTIHPERFQEPTHALSVFLNEHLLKSSFLFETFAGRALLPKDVRMTHCTASTTGSTDCSNVNSPISNRFRAGLFIPRRMKAAARTPAHAFALRLVDMFGRAHDTDGRTTHLNLSTMLVKSHRDQTDMLSATCFRSMLTVDAMFRHLPARALARSRLFSRLNHIDRRPRQHTARGCSITVGMFDLSEGPRGIVSVADFRRSIEQIAHLALPSATVNVELLRIEPETKLDDHIRALQQIDVLIAGSGDEMTSLAYLRGNALAFEILQFGMNPETYRSLASILGIKHFSLQSRPASDAFKNCMEQQVMNMRKKGRLGDGENPPWWDLLMKTWDAAAVEFALSGKTDFDILSNRSAIANFDSRHCAKTQSLVLNHEEAARAIVLQAKSLCEAV